MKLFVLASMLMLSGCYDYSVSSKDITCDAERGECIVCTDSDCSSTISVVAPDPPIIDQCDGSFVSKQLLGTCWTEHCVKGEKTLIPKIAGVNCVFIPAGAINDEFVIGVCDDVGQCGD